MSNRFAQLHSVLWGFIVLRGEIHLAISFSFCNVNSSSFWLVGGPGHVGGFHRDDVLLKTWRGKLLASGG